MSDLSRLLDDVYRTTPAPPGSPWSSESALDEVFSNWIPGPAPASEEPELPEIASIDLVAEPSPTVVRPTLVWSITDDDILPAKPGRRRLFLRRR